MSYAISPFTLRRLYTSGIGFSAVAPSGWPGSELSTGRGFLAPGRRGASHSAVFACASVGTSFDYETTSRAPSAAVFAWRTTGRRTQYALPRVGIRFARIARADTCCRSWRTASFRYYVRCARRRQSALRLGSEVGILLALISQSSKAQPTFSLLALDGILLRHLSLSDKADAVMSELEIAKRFVLVECPRCAPSRAKQHSAAS